MRTRDTLARDGIAPERLLFAGWTATRFDHLALHHAVDIALDPFPHNGVSGRARPDQSVTSLHAIRSFLAFWVSTTMVATPVKE
jgi:hypothetical protein